MKETKQCVAQIQRLSVSFLTPSFGCRVGHFCHLLRFSDLKNKLNLIFFAFVILSLASCGSIFGDRAVNKPVVLNGGSLNCISNISENIRTWSEVGSPDIGQQIDCVVLVLDKFKERVSDRKPGEWTSEDVGRFLDEKLELPDGSKRLNAIMRLKQALFGGAAGVLTSEELSRVRAAILRLKPEAINLTNNLEIVRMKSIHPDPDQSDRVAAVLLNIASILGEEAEKTTVRSDLSFDEIQSGIVALGFDAETISNWIPVARRAKTVLAGGLHENVLASEWPRFLRSAGAVWGLIIRVQYSIRGKTDLLGGNLSVVEKLLNDVLGEVDLSIRSQDKQKIADEKMFNLIDVLGEKGLLPDKISAVTVKGLVRPILGKVLFGNSQPNLEQSEKALTLDHLKLLRFYVDDWLNAQKQIITIYKSHQVGASIIKALRSIFNGALIEANELFYKKQFNDFFSRGRPLVRDEEGRFLISSSKTPPEPNQGDLEQMNLARAVVTALIRGYSHDPEVAKVAGGLSEDEVQELYSDARSLGIDLGFVDVRNTNSGRRTYLEGRLFTSVPNTKELVNVHQATEWFQMAISSNLIGKRLHDQLVEKCGVNEVDFRGFKTLDISCFRNDFAKNLKNIIPNLPGFYSFIQSDKTGERIKEVTRNLEEAGRTGGAVEEPIYREDTSSLLSILYYTESLFQTWDRNSDDLLDKDEIWKFFPVMQPVLKKLGAGNADSEFMQKAIFSWMLAKGELPSTSVIGGAKLIAWGMFSTSYDLKATRLEILKVMAGLAVFNRENIAAKISEFVKSDPYLLMHMAQGDISTVAAIRDIFQCQKSATSDLSDMLRTHAAEFVPKGAQNVSQNNVQIDVKSGAVPFVSIEPIIFTQKMKSLLKADLRFAQVCLPF